MRKNTSKFLLNFPLGGCASTPNLQFEYFKEFKLVFIAMTTFIHIPSHHFKK